jgi:hypothetical protein
MPATLNFFWQSKSFCFHTRKMRLLVYIPRLYPPWPGRWPPSGVNLGGINLKRRSVQSCDVKRC